MRVGDRINNVDGSKGYYISDNKVFFTVRTQTGVELWNSEDIRFSIRQTITNVCDKAENWIIEEMPEIFDKFTVRTVAVVCIYLLGMLTIIITLK